MMALTHEKASDSVMPVESPKQNGVGAGRSAVAVRAASRRWLSFFR